MDEHKKFTEAEIIVGLLVITIPVDAASFLIDWTGVGLVLAPILQSAAMFATWLWLRSKGDTSSLKLGRQLGRYLSNALPLLPTVTAVFLIEVYLHNHPETGIGKALQGAQAAHTGLKTKGGIKAKTAAARKAYRDAPLIPPQQLQELERLRAGPPERPGDAFRESFSQNIPENHPRPKLARDIPSPAGPQAR